MYNTEYCARSKAITIWEVNEIRRTCVFRIEFKPCDDRHIKDILLRRLREAYKQADSMAHEMAGLKLRISESDVMAHEYAKLRVDHDQALKVIEGKSDEIVNLTTKLAENENIREKETQFHHSEKERIFKMKADLEKEVVELRNQSKKVNEEYE